MTDGTAENSAIRPDAALAALEANGNLQKADEMAVYHKASRRYLGLPMATIDSLVAEWRRDTSTAERVALAGGLWDSDVHEARIAATKLLTQARIPVDEPLVWHEVKRWVPTFDAWATSDHACKVAERRLIAVPDRLDEVESWTGDPNKWVRRAALVSTLPWSKMVYPTEEERAERERILGWAAGYVRDGDWFIQKAIAWWLRTLSIRDPKRVLTFLDGPGAELKGFARREALRRMR